MHSKPGGRGGGGGGRGRGRGRGQYRGAVSTYDKRQVIQKARNLKAKKVNKYRRTLKRLEADGRLAAPPALRDGLDDLDAADPLADLSHGGGGSDGSGGSSGGEEEGEGGAPRQQRQKQRWLPPPPTEPATDAGARGQQGKSQRGPRLGGSGDDDGAEAEGQQHEGHGRGRGRRRGGATGPPSQLERLAAKRRAQLEEEQKAKEERLVAAQRRREELEAKERQRKASKAKFFAKTRHGQPQMRHRIEGILEKLQAEAKPPGRR
ncbi:hypothetical protein MNEG_1649 [Monoraphidium neglectum]|uniref:rRNA-processing protein FYV7 n=1 Tax=Monoraphidium neglectum TaxID=145388 RepID=A0A0D2N1A5_9CHLO|nr:hypothetical protein MNEG_1649 [Monoraphidium neglectum]KIZ06312.1 hypothetical protein MNEG_1649 [Monoraphidium neglectum]|eukprot:XP_013905331.1 hypothetical protein MNEG_1649 [Monoraphidium neglectum]